MLPFLCLAVLCVDCHKDIVERYERTPMANTSGAVRASSEFPGWFEHSASRTRFEIVRAGDALELRWSGSRVTLEFFIGSRRMGRSYAFSERGYLYQAPVGYYATRRGWDMAPGYQADKRPDLDRPITAECLFCHAGPARLAEGTLNRVVNLGDLHGVSCERCHGDGSAHAAQPRSGNILNPGKLRPAARDAVCEQCHLAGAVRLALPGRDPRDFRPGEELSDYVQVFVSSASSRGIRVNGHAEALAASKCRQAAPERLWCGTCHSPHRQATGFREKCLECHQTLQCISPARNDGDCTRCHMPKGAAYDGGHTVFTDHSIPRRPPRYAGRGNAPQALRPYYRRALPDWVVKRNLGLAYSELGVQYRQPELLQQAWPLLRAAAEDRPRDPVLYTRMGSLLQADGRTDQAIELYRRSLELDPNQNTALMNLSGLLEARGDLKEAAQLRRRASLVLPRQSGLRSK